MKFENIKKQEMGYMLLESLITLTLIVTILVIFYPLISDWLMLRNNEKHNVEQNRLLYEQSMNWNNESINETRTVRNITYEIKSNTNRIKVASQRQKVEVQLYEVQFD